MTIELVFSKGEMMKVIIIIMALIIGLMAGCSSVDHGNLIPLDKDSKGNEIVYKTPESFIYDEASGVYFISNINGQPTDEDDNGFIIKLDSNLNLIDNYFIDGRSTEYLLSAPKGMVIRDGILYVTDINTVRKFSAGTGEYLGDIDFSKFEPQFLNDPAFDADGYLYISDMTGGPIYKIDSLDNVSVLSMPGSPNGLYYHTDNYLLVAHWNPGKLIIQRLDGSSEDLLTDTGFVNLDGIDVDTNGEIYFSDFTKGVIYKYNVDTKKLTEVTSGLKNPADISLDKVHRRILIPQFGDIAVITKM